LQVHIYGPAESNSARLSLPQMPILGHTLPP
jgi:hypothetical protein